MAVAYAQAVVLPATGAETTLSFAGAPANGSRVVIVAGSESNGAGTPAPHDSNSVSLTPQLSVFNGGGAWTGLWDYVVSGTPTAAFALSQSGGSFWYFLYNISGANGGAEYTSNNSGSLVGTTLVSTIADVTNGDALISAAWDDGGNASALVISNGSNTSDGSFGGILLARHSLATSTASTTATLTAASADPVSMIFARYFATVAGKAIPPNYEGGMSRYTGGMSA